MVIDWILKKERRKRPSGPIPPEIRLKAVWTGEILVPVSFMVLSLSQIGNNTLWAGWSTHLWILYSIQCSLEWCSDWNGYWMFWYSSDYGMFYHFSLLLFS